MDENLVHDLLELAVGEPPPTAVDVALARRQGKRKLRWRRVYVPAVAPVAAAAAVVLIATGLPFGLGSGHAIVRRIVEPRTGQAFIAHPPTRFNLNVPYASFGWLPTGFSADTVLPGVGGAGVGGTQSAHAETLGAPSKQADGKTLSLLVNTAGSCRLTDAGAHELLTAPGRHQRPVSCEDGILGPTAIASRAPDVNGGLAVWDQRGDLIWEYGRDAWAELQPLTLLIEPHLDRHFDGWYNVPAKARSHYAPGHPAYHQSAATRALLVKVAASIHYGGTAAQVYGFTLGGVPADWRTAASPASFQAMDGLIADTGWQLGPASDQTALGISVIPAQDGYPCPFDSGQSEYVTVDGARAILRTIDQPYKHWQSLCVSNIDGLQLSITLDLNVPGTSDRPLPGSAIFSSALAVFRHLKLLGPNTADWTTTPLR